MFRRFPSPSLLLGAVTLVLFSQAAFGSAVKVTKSGQGIYSKPDETRKAATLPNGTVLEVLSASPSPQGWVQVAVPPCVDLWIFVDSVNNGVVTVGTGHVRTSTNTLAPEVARVPRGGTVTVRGREGDWFKIAPPASAKMWVKADAVAPTTEKPARVEEAPVVLGSSSSVPAPILPPVMPVVPTSVAVAEPVLPPAPAPIVLPSAPAPAPKPTPAEPVATKPIEPPAPAPSTTPARPLEPPAKPVIVPAWQPPSLPEAPAEATSPSKLADKLVAAPPPKPAATPHAKPVAVTAPKPIAVAPVRQVRAATPVPPTFVPSRSVPVPATRVPAADTSSWEAPATGSAKHNRGAHSAPEAYSVSADLARVGRTQTFLPRVETEADWGDPTPGTLLPTRKHPRIAGRVPEAIAEERLSPTYVQGKAGRAVGTLLHSEGGLFRGSRYEICTLSEDGIPLERLAVVVGDAATLNRFANRAVRIDGTVWWLRNSLPHLAVETIVPLR